ncbi:hypothetical protein LCGC14_2896320, partial [marine sediment metagenome]
MDNKELVNIIREHHKWFMGEGGS